MTRISVDLSIELTNGYSLTKVFPLPFEWQSGTIDSYFYKEILNLAALMINELDYDVIPLIRDKNFIATFFYDGIKRTVIIPVNMV